jgi:RNase P protein component
MELAAVRRFGTRIRVEYLDVRAMISTLPHARAGFVVPKYGHSSVERNRLKRRLRELVRTRLLPALRVDPPIERDASRDAEIGGDRDATSDANSDPNSDVNSDATRGASPGVTASAGRGTGGHAHGEARDAPAMPSIDVVVRALPAAYDVPFAALAAQVDRVYAGVRQRLARLDG